MEEVRDMDVGGKGEREMVGDEKEGGRWAGYGRGWRQRKGSGKEKEQVDVHREGCLTYPRLGLKWVPGGRGVPIDVLRERQWYRYVTLVKVRKWLFVVLPEGLGQKLKGNSHAYEIRFFFIMVNYFYSQIG